MFLTRITVLVSATLLTPFNFRVTVLKLQGHRDH
jgi:hypothetical protein